MTGLVDLKYFYFLMYYLYVIGWLSESLGQEGHPQPQILKIKIKYDSTSEVYPKESVSSLSSKGNSSQGATEKET